MGRERERIWEHRSLSACVSLMSEDLSRLSEQEGEGRGGSEGKGMLGYCIEEAARAACSPGSILDPPAAPLRVSVR